MSESPILIFLYFFQVRADLEGRAGRQFDEFKAVEYSTQVVAGINYFIRVCITVVRFRRLRRNAVTIIVNMYSARYTAVI
jgi:Cystatin domain